MHENRIDEWCLRYMVYSYSLEDLNSSNINEIIISRFSEIFFKSKNINLEKKKYIITT